MDDWRKGQELKVFGYINLCRLIYLGMMDRGSGTIVNVIGMAGSGNRPDYICGSAGNAALIAFTNALGAEAQGSGGRAFGINPSPTLTGRMERFLRHNAKTDFGDEERWKEVIDPARYPFGRPAEPSEIGTLATMLCAPTVAYLNGTVIDMDRGGQWKD